MSNAPGLGQNGQIDAEHALEHTRTCAGCRSVIQLQVLGKGEARYSRGNTTDARLAAKHAAWSDATLLAGLAPCPRCGTREGRAVRAVVLHVFVRLALAAAILGVCEYAERNAQMDLGPFWLVALGVVWVLFVSAVAVNIRRFVGAKKRVVVAIA
jgi:hypothetical protein